MTSTLTSTLFLNLKAKPPVKTEVYSKILNTTHKWFKLAAATGFTSMFSNILPSILYYFLFNLSLSQVSGSTTNIIYLYISTFSFRKRMQCNFWVCLLLHYLCILFFWCRRKASYSSGNTAELSEVAQVLLKVGCPF